MSRRSNRQQNVESSGQVRLKLGNQNIQPGQFVDIQQARQTPVLEWPEEAGLSYTIVFYDPTARYLHWVSRDDQDIVSYTPPNPPAGERHEYVFAIFASPQGSEADLSFLQPGRSRTQGRVDFNVSKYNFGQLVGETSFVTGVEVGESGLYTEGDYFRPETPLSDQQRKFCRAAYHVAARGQARNPWAVAAASTGTSLGRGWTSCEQWVRWTDLPDNEIIAVAELEGVTLPTPYNRARAIAAMEDHVETVMSEKSFNRNSGGRSSGRNSYSSQESRYHGSRSSGGYGSYSQGESRCGCGAGSGRYQERRGGGGRY
jgi:hypothetical protein